MDLSWVGFELGWARRSSAVLLELPFYRTAVLVLCRSSSLPFYRTAVLKAAVLCHASRDGEQGS